MDLLSPLYCATLQCHKGNLMASLRQVVRAYIAEHLQIEFQVDPGWARHRSYNTSVVNLLLSEFCSVEDDGHVLGTKRRNIAKRLLDCLPGDWRDVSGNGVIHYCPYGCCPTREAAVEKVFRCIEQFLLMARPRVPACNRWTKLYQPCAWFATAFSVHGIVAHALKRLKGSHAEQLDQLPGIVDLVGPSSDNIFRVQEAIRWQKCQKWLLEPETPLRLSLAVTLMLPALHRMHGLFKQHKEDVGLKQRSWNGVVY
eukprot:6492744-Amphidinium_carterae.3